MNEMIEDATTEIMALPRMGPWDWPLFIVTAVLASFGLLMILSASTVLADDLYRDAFHFVTRQGVGLLFGVLTGLVLVFFPWTWVRRCARPAFVFSLILLCLVLTPLGHSVNGAARWIDLGFMNFQPSELAKLALIWVLAQYLACNEGRVRDVVGIVVPGLVLFVLPILFMMVYQKDFGTTVILLGVAGLLFFLAGLQTRYVALMGILTTAFLAILVVIEPYRIRRLMSFLDPFSDPELSGYQVVQGWIALAAGGLTGEGLASGVAQRGFLPEAHTDFIGAVVGEELGGIGWTLMILTYIFIIWRGTL
ncbi:MAG: FtsW/RodA/SpoVE family cell cycle protein, partial [Proteobacteria bacterium]|nr:FtsW/RodA/SpoVE family cell cycle protein [Pseudomonadota bacterium]